MRTVIARGAGIIVFATCFGLSPSTGRADDVVSWKHLSTAKGDFEVPFAGDEQTAALVLDIDKDGRNDFVIAERTGTPSVVWYRRGAFEWTVYTIETTPLRIEAGGTFHDIDGDDDLDIVLAHDFAGNEIWWWENPYPNFDPAVEWTQRTIKNSGGDKHHDQLFGDVDGDDVVELVSWNQGSQELLLFEIPPDPRNYAGEWPRTTIANVPSLLYEGLDIADIDLDGKNDIVGAGRWYRHDTGTTFDEFVIDGSPGREFTRTAVGQLIPGGRPEVVISPGDTNGFLAWYQWNGSTWTVNTLDNLVLHGHSLAIADINNDGHQDIFVAEMGDPGAGADCQSRIFYGDSAGNFDEQTVSVGIANHESRVGDLDGDGDLDILSKPFNFNTPRVDVFLNQGPKVPIPLDNWTTVTVDNARSAWGDFEDPIWVRYFGLGWRDVTGDGFLDLVSGRYFYRNPGGEMLGPWPRTDFGFNVDGLLLVDIDGDAFGDAIGTRGETVYWLEADDILGSSWTPYTIDTTAPSAHHINPQGYVIADLEPGGKPEIVISNGFTLFYYPIPLSNPEAGNWTRIRILANSNSEGIGVTDIDGDGLLDVATVHESNGTFTLVWMKNPGDGTPDWTMYPVSPDVGDDVDRIAVADLNGDGHIDIVTTQETPLDNATSRWYEGPADPTQPDWTEHAIVTQHTTNSMDVADMDCDGDIDVILAEHRSSTNMERLAIWENDGTGSFSEVLIDQGKEGHLGARVVDLDRDGDLEIINIAWDDYPRMYMWRNDNGGTPLGNQPPFVNVGPDRVVVLPNTLDLDAVVSDDGKPMPPGSLTLTWRKISGPGTVAFSDENAASTTVTFGEVGSYVLELEADDSELVTTDQVTVSVTDEPEIIDDSLVALYTFDEGEGTVVHDVSCNGDPLDLTILDPDNVTWGAGSLTLDTSTTISSGSAATKLHDAITATSEITIEAWMAPANLTQDGPARIATMSLDTGDRNFTFGQGRWAADPPDTIDVRLRTTVTGEDAKPSVTSPTGLLEIGLKHVVYTRAADGATHIYIDGQPVLTDTVDGDMSNWSSSYPFAIGNELTGERPWLGTLHMMAIYNRALGASEVDYHYQIGASSIGAASDLDSDGDVDAEDYDVFEGCASGPGVPVTEGCEPADLDKDGDADQGDFALLQQCFHGADVMVSPCCAN